MSAKKKHKSYAPGHYSLARSFGWAVAGFVHALLHERNLRIHLAAAAWVIFLSRYYSLSRAEAALMILLMGFVITCELVNTAIENIVDLITHTHNDLARIAKDVAAGAVLVAAIASAAAGFFLFWDTQVFAVIRSDLLKAPVAWGFFLALTAVWIALPQKKKNHPPFLKTDRR